jgi:hypothetical protein
MADKVANHVRGGACQDTGNPVLDSTVNLLANWPCEFHPDKEYIKQLHAVLLELHAAEPGKQGRLPPGQRPNPRTLKAMSDAAEGR